MSDASTSAPSMPNLGYRLARAGLSPAALAHAGIAVIVAGLCLIAVNGDAVGYRNASVRVLERPAQVHGIYARRTETLELRPSLDLM
jgi:hypothetical protein